jgi:hypothetical protein
MSAVGTKGLWQRVAEQVAAEPEPLPGLIDGETGNETDRDPGTAETQRREQAVMQRHARPVRRPPSWP